MAKLTFKEELCKGCGLCVDACPRNLLALSKTRLNQKGHAAGQIALDRARRRSNPITDSLLL